MVESLSSFYVKTERGRGEREKVNRACLSCPTRRTSLISVRSKLESLTLRARSPSKDSRLRRSGRSLISIATRKHRDACRYARETRALILAAPLAYTRVCVCVRACMSTCPHPAHPCMSNRDPQCVYAPYEIDRSPMEIAS